MQKQWSFFDPFGKLYIIGFYHGHDSGNFILYINNNISIIDFNIKENKDYSFILGNRLLKLTITKATQGFNYDLKDNTPPPQLEKWEVLRDKIAAVLMILSVGSGFVALILLATGYFSFQ